MKLRIYADFNSQDELGRVDLQTAGSRQDLECLKDYIRSELPVVLYFDDIEIDAILQYELETGRWYGRVQDWSSYRDLA
jgi:hypothetical protein